ncbi:MAG: hypothetical protein KF715_19730 [Candidatus Didemnitutus sp.]|nr:hypothetical protein [Candidatus Didemnitutus sp.]
MEFRFVVLNFLAATALVARPVSQVMLDERVCHEIRIGTETPTTIVFPAAIAALDGANVSTKPDAPVLLSHQPGTAYLAVRANRTGATGGLNVMLRGKAYALAFRTDEVPDRTVTFVERTDAPVTPSSGGGAVGMLGLLDRAKHADAFAAQYPALSGLMERIACPVGPGTRRVLQAFRFAAEQALVLQWRVENRRKETVRYAPGRVRVSVGERSFRCALTDASGQIPAGTAETFWIVVREIDAGDLKLETLRLEGIETR